MSKIKRFFTAMVFVAAVTALDAGEQKTAVRGICGGKSEGRDKAESFA